MSDKDRISADDDPRRNIDEIGDDAEAGVADLDDRPLGFHGAGSGGHGSGGHGSGGHGSGDRNSARDGLTKPDGLPRVADPTVAGTAGRPGPPGMGHVAEHESDDWWRTWIGRTGAILAGALVLATALIWAWVGGLTNPIARDVPVAVIHGDTTSIGVLAALRTQSPAIRAVPYATAADAQNALSRRAVDAILASDATSLDGGLNLSLAGGAGPGISDTVTTAVGVATTALNIPLAVEDVHPVSAKDPRGLAPFYVTLGWILGGLLAAVALGVAVGTVPRDLDRLGLRIGALAVYSLLLGLLSALFVGPVLGVWSRHLFGLWMCGALITMTAALVTAALQSWLGMWGVGIAVLLLLILGVPGSGGTVAPDLLPGFFRGMHWWIPTGQGTDLVRGLEYFGRRANTWPIVGLTLWSLASVVALVGATAVLGRPARDGYPAATAPVTPPATVEQATA